MVAADQLNAGIGTEASSPLLPPAERAMPLASVAMLYEHAEQHSLAVGRRVAVRQMVQAIGLYSQSHQLTLLCPDRQRPAIAREFNQERGIVAVDRSSARDIDQFQLAAWHEIQLDLFTPFTVRERAQRPFPITMVHHTISYKSLLHGSFLRLLLAKPRPFDSMICTSTAAKEALVRIFEHVAGHFEAEHGVACPYRGRFDVIPLGTDTERFHPMDRGEARAALQLDPEAFVMFWLGRLSPIDKADLLPFVMLLADLVARYPKRKLLFVCAGTQRAGEQFGDVIQSYAASLGIGEHVQVRTDWQRFNPWTAHMYAAADVFVAPTDNVQETFGLTPIEAMAAGVPQVVADWNGYRDTVVDGETGFLIPTVGAPRYRDIDDGAVLTDPAFDHLSLASGVAVDLAALATALGRLIEDEALRRQMGAASRKRALEVFGWPVVVARYETLWQELAAEARGVASADRRTSYAMPAYGSFFESYPTRLLRDDQPMWLTPRGEAALQHPTLELPLHYNQVFRYLEVSLLQRALEGLRRFAIQDKPLTVGHAVAVLSRGKDSSARQDAVRRHLVWLMKYGYVTLISPD